jgi:hypothetical protein
LKAAVLPIVVFRTIHHWMHGGEQCKTHVSSGLSVFIRVHPRLNAVFPCPFLV